MRWHYVIKKHARVNVKRFLKWNAAIVSSVISVPRIDPHKILVLMYHRVNNYRRDELSVAPRELRNQVLWLRENGFRNMRMAELESVSGKNWKDEDVPRVIFTFDDGYEDNYLEAFPILKEFGYTGIFYLTVDYIGSERMYPLDVKESNLLKHNRIMNWEQAAELLKGGMEIGSHGLSHSILTRIPENRARLEIRDSKLLLERNLGTTITSFCYPGGYFDNRHVALVREAGYRSACTTYCGFWHGEDLFRIPRISVLASDSFFIFKKKILGRMEWFKM